MKSKKLLLIGGGGHCKSVLDSLMTNSNYREISIIDTIDNVGKLILSKKIIGTDVDLENLFKKGYQEAFITLGSIGDTRLRRKLFNKIRDIGYEVPNIIDSSAAIGTDVVFGKGVFIGKNAVVNAGTILGDGVIVNSGSVVEHDCNIGAFSHISPGSTLCGNVIIESNVHIGAGTIVKQQVFIGSDTIIGMGSVVLKNFLSHSYAYGNPCENKSKSGIG